MFTIPTVRICAHNQSRAVLGTRVRLLGYAGLNQSRSGPPGRRKFSPTRRVASRSCEGPCFPSYPSRVVHAHRGRASSTPSHTKPAGNRCIAPFVTCRVPVSPSCVVVQGNKRGLNAEFAGKRAAAPTQTAAQDSVYHHSIREWSIITVHATLSHCMHRTLRLSFHRSGRASCVLV